MGICKTGPEVHEHIDEGLFKRLGLPEWLITNTVDEYVAQAIRLAENHQERLALRRHIIENNGLATLFTGDPSPMGKVLLEKLNEWKAEHLGKQEKPKAKAAPKKTTAKKTTKAATAKSTSSTAKKATKASPLKEAANKLKKKSAKKPAQK